MDEVSLFLRIILGTIMLSSGISKLKNIYNHINTIKNYQIIHESYTKTFGWFDLSLEILSGLILLVGFFTRISAAIIIFLLLLYIIAISINLLRGRTEISCGCGGLNGNHQISWLLVTRNFILILASCWLIFNEGTLGNLQLSLLKGNWSQNYNFTFYITVISSYTILFLMISLSNIRLIYKKIQLLY